MVKYLLTAIALVTFTGCDKPLANEEIIKETHKCEDAGLVALRVTRTLDGMTMGISCAPASSY